MKKILSISTICILFISIIASVSPEVHSHLKLISNDAQYTSSIIPAPNSSKFIENYAIEEGQNDNYAVTDEKKNFEIDIEEIQFVE